MATPIRPITLFSLQAKGHDIRADYTPRGDYSDARGPYYCIAKHLGWRHWVWAFADLRHFHDDCIELDPARLNGLDLWQLSVPLDAVRWVALHAYHAAFTPSSWFFDTPEDIIAAGDIPQALIERPLPSVWVVRVVPGISLAA